MTKPKKRFLLALLLMCCLLFTALPQPAQAAGATTGDIVIHVHINGNNRYNHPSEYDLNELKTALRVLDANNNSITPTINSQFNRLTYAGLPLGEYKVQFAPTVAANLGFTFGGGAVPNGNVGDYLDASVSGIFDRGWITKEYYVNFVPEAIGQTEAPQVNAPIAGQTTVTGTSAPNAAITVTLNGQTHSGYADENGALSVSVPVLKADEQVRVTAKAEKESLSSPTIVTVSDLAATDTPEVDQPKAGDTQVTGTTDPKARVTVTTPAGTYTVQASNTGAYSAPVPALQVDDPITVTAQAPGKNPSAPVDAITQAVVLHQTATPGIDAPKAGDVVITGTTEAQAQVTITTPHGTYTANATQSGAYTVPVPELQAGDTITATAIADGKTQSDAAHTTATEVVQAVTPAPTLNPLKAGDTTVSGQSEPGAAITLQTADGIYTATADQNGHFTITVPALKAGSAISAKAQAPNKLESRDTLAGVPGSSTTGPMDSDGDGYTDAFEIEKGTDPYDPKSYPVVEKVITRPGGGTETIYVPVEKDVVVQVDTHVAYISGYPNGSFGANRPITRAEVAAILTRIDGGTAGALETFPDVTADAWFAGPIAYVSSQGVMGGYPDGTFRPNEAITRAEVASLLQRYRHLSGGQHNPFHDITGHWAAQSILDVSQAGYVAGYPDGTYRPNSPITRTEFVAMTNRMLQRTPDKAYIDAHDFNRFNDITASHWGYYEVIEAAVTHRFELQNEQEGNWKVTL